MIRRAASAKGLRAGASVGISITSVRYQLLRAGCRELRNPTRRAGRIPLSGLVLAHSRHNRVFFARSSKPQAQKCRICRERAQPPWRRFLGAKQHGKGVRKPGQLLWCRPFLNLRDAKLRPTLISLVNESECAGLQYEAGYETHRYSRLAEGDGGVTPRFFSAPEGAKPLHSRFGTSVVLIATNAWAIASLRNAWLTHSRYESVFTLSGPEVASPERLLSANRCL